jgi:hypothetical protein
MSGDRPELSVDDELILAGLVAGLTHAEAGALADRSAKSVQRRLGDAAFAAEVTRRRAEQVERVAGRLTALSDRAVAVLGASLTDDRAVSRLRAADLILSWTLRLRRESDLERRLAEIELVLAERKGSSR